MNRFEKKCFIGSAAFHGLLLLVLICGAAFLPSKKTEELPPVITIFGAQVTDRAIASGGNPNVTPTPTPPAAPPEPQQVQPSPPKPEPLPPKPEVKPEPTVAVKPQVKPKPEPKKDLVEKDDGDLAVQKQPKKNITTTNSLISKTIIRRPNDTERIQKEAAERQARDRERDRQETARLNEQQRKFANEVGNIIGGVGKSINKAPVVQAAGPGGAAYVNYGSLVGEIYKRAVYATQPQSDQDAEALIKILVARDGTVRSSQWVRRTGNSVLDKAVDRAMNSVRSLPGFPSETKDLERSFNITIAFEAKRVSA